MKKLFKKIIWLIVYILFVAGLVWGTPKALSWALKTQYPMAAITSGSMWPALKKGDLVFIQGIDPKTVQVGEIIVYLNEKNAFTIHRIIELKEDAVITKGDANNIADSPIKYEDIIGKLYKIGDWNTRLPKLGFISTTMSRFR